MTTPQNLNHRDVVDKLLTRYRAEIAKRPTHTFRKRNLLWYFNPQYKGTSLLKVVECSPYILLVKNLDYPGGIPYRIEPEHFQYCKLAARPDVYLIAVKRVLTKGLHLLRNGLFFVKRRLHLHHTTTPQNLWDYAANWLAFAITLVARCESYLWYPAGNTFNDLAAHGPLWKARS